MKNLQRIAITLAVALLPACVLGPDYEQPEVSAPEAYRESTVPGESLAHLEWWDLFDDEQLAQLIETALQNNREMAIAMARIEEARASLGFVRADQFPNVNGAAQANRGNALLGIPGPIEEQYVLAADLSFEVDLWGRLRRSTEAARAELYATLEARNIVTITLIADTASTYLLLLDLDKRVQIAQRTRVTREDSLKIVSARYAKGVVPQIDVNQAEIELADAQAEQAALERQREQAENLLSILLGQNPGPILRSAEPAKKSLQVPDIPTGLPSELLERRPDVRKAAQELAAQTARIGVAEAQRFPSLSLTGSLGLVSPELDNFLSSDNKSWSVGAGLLGPIFDAGRSKSRVEVERARTEQLLQQYQLTVLEALREVEDSLIEIRSFQNEANAREAQKIAARSATRLSRARYDGGVTSYLEVLESERSLFRAELLASSTRREQVVAIVSLYKALGGGWPTSEEVDAAGGYIEATLPR